MNPSRTEGTGAGTTAGVGARLPLRNEVFDGGVIAMRGSFIRAIIAIVFLTLLLAGPIEVTTAQTPVVPGGFLEKTTSGNVRPLYTAAQVQGFLPSRGEIGRASCWERL